MSPSALAYNLCHCIPADAEYFGQCRHSQAARGIDFTNSRDLACRQPCISILYASRRAAGMLAPRMIVARAAASLRDHISRVAIIGGQEQMPAAWVFNPIHHIDARIIVADAGAIIARMADQLATCGHDACGQIPCDPMRQFMPAAQPSAPTQPVPVVTQSCPYPTVLSPRQARNPRPKPGSHRNRQTLSATRNRAIHTGALAFQRTTLKRGAALFAMVGL